MLIYLKKKLFHKIYYYIAEKMLLDGIATRVFVVLSVISCSYCSLGAFKKIKIFN